ncbi:hypothetical protein DFH09DRAFT_198369 [Mycena vulgaris]|nr:hypothetical protein DFH09DRAFT_198369 [Mycena vulgaris]
MAEPLTTHPDQWVERRGARRTVPMKVLVLGYPRTGTASMREALQILGYSDVHHMNSIFSNPPEADMWTEAINGRFFGQGKPYGRTEWDQLLGRCQAVTDTPAAMFAEDLISAYPDAQVILGVRDVDEWWKSFAGSIGTVVKSRRYHLAAYLDPHGLGKVARLGRLIVSVIIGPVATEEAAKTRYIEYYSKVRSIVPKERLLEHEVKEGWTPLCAFLGKEVPDVEFPRTNDRKMLHDRFEATMDVIFRRFALRTVLPCVLLMTGVVFAIYAKL